MTDEAHFHVSGYVNKQNYRYWAPENPQELISVLPQRKIDCLLWDRIVWSSWHLLSWRQRRCNRHCDIRALCGNATQLLWTRVTSSWDRSPISMVSARWSNNPHSKGINKCSAGNVSTTRHFPWQRCSMAGKFSRSLRLWLLFMRVSQKQNFHL